jgi:hypothetical protein
VNVMSLPSLAGGAQVKSLFPRLIPALNRS